MGKYLDMLQELEAGKKSGTPMSPPEKPNIYNLSGNSGTHLGASRNSAPDNSGISGCHPRVSGNSKTESITSETKPKLPTEPANHPAARVYRVVLETDGVHKGMTVIDPSGDDMAAFRQSCNRRFGEARVISEEPRQ